MLPHATHHRLLVPPSGYAASVLTGTNSTCSNLTGAGRTLGKLLSRTGRALELTLNRGAERLGFGPAAAVRRLLVLLLIQHKRRSGCLYNVRSLNVPDVSSLLHLAMNPCDTCGQSISFDLSAGMNEDEAKALLAKLLGYTMYVFYNMHVYFLILQTTVSSQE
jgi:hypothetical protein